MTKPEMPILERPVGIFAARIESVETKVMKRTVAIVVKLADDQGFLFLSYNIGVMLKRLKQQALARREPIPCIDDAEALMNWLRLLAERKIPFAFERRYRCYTGTYYEDIVVCKYDA